MKVLYKRRNMSKIKYTLCAILPAIMILLAAAGLAGAQTKPWITAYVGGWDLNYDNNGSMPISGINFKGMTVCDHMSILPATSGTFLDTVNAYMTQANSSLLISAAHSYGVKVTVTIGAWSTESAFLVATSPANLPTFVGNLVAFVKERGYDGVDIDWEPFSATDAPQWEALVKALRQALPSPYLITVTSAWGEPYSAFAAVQSDIDQINLMTYDFDTDAPGYNTWYAAPVYSNGVTIPANGQPMPSCDDLVKAMEAAGIQAAKIGIGSEPGGCLWKGVTGANQSISTVTSWQEDIPYNTIMSQYYNSSLYHYDSGAGASYLSYNGGTSSSDWFLSYDDTTALAAKLAYVKSSGIGGLIIYEIGMSYSNGTNPFLNVTQEFLQNGTTSTPTAPSGPTVSITSPASGSTISGTISVSANVTDNSSITGVTFKVDGSQVGSTVTVAPYSVSENTATLSNGSHTVTATATDAAGNSATASVTVNVSNTTTATSVPTVAITSPMNGTTLSGMVTLSASATDNAGISDVQFKCDNYNLGSALASAPYSMSVNTDSLANGSHTFYAVASDDAGNTATASVTVIVSNTTSQASQTGLTVYQNTLDSPWINASYGAAINFSNASPVYPGASSSIKIVNNAWGTLYLHNGNWGTADYIKTASYNNLTFWAYSSQNISLMIFLGNDAGQHFPTVTAQSIPVGQWTLVSIPLAQLNPGGYNVQDVGIMESSGTTKTYYVDGIVLTSSSSSPVAPTNTPQPSSTAYTVFGDSLQSPWMDASWSAKVNYSNTAPVFSGTHSIKVVASSWGALSIHYGNWGSTPLTSTAYDTVRFEAYTTTPTSLALKMENDQGSRFSEASIGTVQAGQWTLIRVPVSALDPSNQAFSRLDIINCSSSRSTFYVDNLQLVQIPSSSNKVSTGIQSAVAQLPKNLMLEQNYPNPFNPSTTINFVLPSDSHVTLQVYNVLGQEVATLANGIFQAGMHAVVWNPGGLASGIYIYRIETDKGSTSKRMVYLK